jgi:predicted DNA binding CopG/RHH family protein
VVKVLREKKLKKTPISLGIREDILARTDEAAKAAGVARQALIEAILEQVLSDKSFVLRIKTD